MGENPYTCEQNTIPSGTVLTDVGACDSSIGFRFSKTGSYYSEIDVWFNKNAITSSVKASASADLVCISETSGTLQLYESFGDGFNGFEFQVWFNKNAITLPLPGD